MADTVDKPESLQPTPAPIREGQTASGALDMANPRDVALVRRATGVLKRSRWNVSPEKRAELIECLGTALDIAKDHADYASMNNCIRTFVAMEAQNQADDHLADKNERLDSGKATEGIQFIIERAGGQATPDQGTAEATRLPDGD